MGPRLTRGRSRRVSPSVLVQWLLSIGGRELNFKVMDLIPLGVSSPALRYREKLLQASAGGHRLWCVHGGIIPSSTSAIRRQTYNGAAKGAATCASVCVALQRGAHHGDFIGVPGRYNPIDRASSAWFVTRRFAGVAIKQVGSVKAPGDELAVVMLARPKVSPVATAVRCHDQAAGDVIVRTENSAESRSGRRKAR